MHQTPEGIPCTDAYGRPMLAKKVAGLYGEQYWVDALDLARPKKLITLLTRYRGQFLRLYDLKKPPLHGGAVHRDNLLL